MRALLCFAAKRLGAAIPLVIFVPVIFSALSFSQSGTPPLAAQEMISLSARRPLVTEPLDESKLAVLKGNTHRLARSEFDLGTAPATLSMQRMLLVMKRSPEQESSLRKLLDDQQDKSSPSYHKWVTPEEFGKIFGPTDADVQTITGWLQSHGFQVSSTKGRTILEFSGSASQVQETFHTAIHKYIVNEEQHWANANDPLIPAALTPAVAGVLTLHNFLKKPQLHVSKEPIAAKIHPGGRPAITFSDGNHGLAPADFATIYNSVSAGVTGNGITIGVIGRSNLYSVNSPAQDIGEFRSSQTFNLCCGGVNIFLNGPDPGDLGGGEEGEATLDTTWSGAVAPGATVDLVVSASTNTTDGIDLSEVYIIENNLADVMTESFGGCEAFSNSAQAAGISALAEQAAAQGITYFVSAGDAGAEGCDDPNGETIATGPVSVNLLAATPFNVAVGGTVFNEHGQSSLYWSTSNTNQESALSYIPEDVWNDSCLASTCGSNANIAAGSGGASTFFSKPPWQTGATGILNDNSRDLPDVSLTASGHDGYVLCLEGSCVPDAQGNFFLYLVGGTSASAPAFAGIMALVDQHMANVLPSLGPRQGLANYILYQLAASQNATLSACNGSSISGLPASTCIFNDVTVGNNAVPGEFNYGSTTAQYQAGVGYDMASGLGSVNITNLVNQWSSGTVTATSTSLLLNNTNSVSLSHGQSMSVNISVTPSSGTGVPTGDVSLLASNGNAFTTQNGLGFFTLSGTGTVVSSTDALPGGGPYNVSAHYPGGGNYGASDSPPVSVTVTPEASTTTLSVLTADSQGNPVPFLGGPFGSFAYLRADVAGVSGHGTPTGAVTFADTFGPIPGGSIYPLDGGDQINNGSNTATPNGVLNFDTGTHTISASYSGDASFNPSGSTQLFTFTIQPGFFVTMPPNQAVMISAPGLSGSTSVAVSSSTGFSGTITLACSGLPAAAACVFSSSSIKATGTAATTSSTVTVTTSSGKAAMLPLPVRPSLGRWLALSSLMFFSIVLIGVPGRRRVPLFLLSLLTLILLIPGCGGGGGSSTPPPPPPVPATLAGTYNITVTASSGSITSATGFTLLVQ
jgi:Pro-kumamolisin, activation domain/Bacterial Ig-like domain (group 3)